MNEGLSFKKSHYTDGYLLVIVHLFAQRKSDSLYVGQNSAISYDSTFYFTSYFHKCNPIPPLFCQHSLGKKCPVV